MKKYIFLICVFLMTSLNIFSQDYTLEKSEFINKYQGTYIDKTKQTDYKIILKYYKDDICIVYSENLFLSQTVNFIKISKLLKSSPNFPAIMGGADKGSGGIETKIFFIGDKLYSNVTRTESKFNNMLNEFDETIIRSKTIFFEKISDSTINNGVDINFQSVINEFVVVENLRLRLNEEKNSEILATMPEGTIVKVKSIGKLEIVDDIESNWIQIEIMNDTKDSEGKLIPKGLTGWCFGGYVR